MTASGGTGILLNALSLEAVERPIYVSVESRWLEYLRSLPQRRLATEAATSTAERLWHRLQKSISSILPPNASPTDDGGVLMSWTRNGRHVEIEVMSDARYEWFYRYRADNVTEGPEEYPADVAPPPALLLRLTETFA